MEDRAMTKTAFWSFSVTVNVLFELLSLLSMQIIERLWTAREQDIRWAQKSNSDDPQRCSLETFLIRLAQDFLFFSILNLMPHFQWHYGILSSFGFSDHFLKNLVQWFSTRMPGPTRGASANSLGATGWLKAHPH